MEEIRVTIEINAGDKRGEKTRMGDRIENDTKVACASKG